MCLFYVTDVSIGAVKLLDKYLIWHYIVDY